MDVAITTTRIIEILSNNEIILTPTDTIWGLSCNPFDENTYKKIFSIKKRDYSKKLILLVSDITMLRKYVVIHPKVDTLLRHHHRPLTVIYEALPSLPKYLQMNDGTVAVRIVSRGWLNDVISEFDAPIASTSANISDVPYPNSREEISESIVNQVDYVVEDIYEVNNTNEPSVIAKLDDRAKELIFIRE